MNDDVTTNEYIVQPKLLTNNDDIRRYVRISLLLTRSTAWSLPSASHSERCGQQVQQRSKEHPVIQELVQHAV
jgi:hypothetical protein